MRNVRKYRSRKPFRMVPSKGISEQMVIVNFLPEVGQPMTVTIRKLVNWKGEGEWN